MPVLNILCGASHLTLRHASDIKELLEALSTQGGDENGEAEKTLTTLGALGFLPERHRHAVFVLDGEFCVI